MILSRDVLAVRDKLAATGESGGPGFAIGLRLSAKAACELRQGDCLARFRDWLDENNCNIFTINGFPYGNFHGTRVKENVFRPDWTDPGRIGYTKDLFHILAAIARPETGASVSTLPGSHKSFDAEESLILRNLCEFAGWLDDFSDKHGIDFHLGLEPEPLGHFENTAETIAFFDRLGDSPALRRRIGLNYDSCHFAIEFDDAASSLAAISGNNIRLSKIHLSNALALDPQDAAAITAIRAFDEPTYFHQVIARNGDRLHRFHDLPDFLAADHSQFCAARVHFHIPLDADPAPPLRSTRDHVEETISWCAANPGACTHFEIETYTWAVLPAEFRRPLTDQIAGEYHWVRNRFASARASIPHK